MLCTQKLFVSHQSVQSICISTGFSTHWIWRATAFRQRHLATETVYLANKIKPGDVAVSGRHLMNCGSPVAFLIRLQNPVWDFFDY